MRVKPLYIRLLIFFVLIVISVNQLVWIHNMYRNYKEELSFYTNHFLQQAILFEVNERGEKAGGFLLFSAGLSSPNDTSRYFMKEVRGADTTYCFRIDKYDMNTNLKIIQFLFKKIEPVNLETVHRIFRNELSRYYPLKESYLEYLDIENDSVIKSNRPQHLSSTYLVSDTIIMDIAPSIAMLAYVEMPESLILKKMVFQLVLSIILILFAVLSLLYLIRSFSLQWREEKLRQESVNAMTHEFKRPISGAISMVSLIPYYLERNKAEKAQSYAQNTLLELNKLTAYTQRIQQISNNDKKGLVLNIVEIELKSFFENLVQKYQNTHKDLDINLLINTEQTVFRADLLHFSNVMDNLIENAVKYSLSDVEIIIRISSVANEIAISVEDKGMGIKKEDIKYIFDRYYRSKQKSVRQKPGFGLGLTYVKSTIEAHGGRITVDSEFGKGSVFTVFLNK